MHFVRNFGDEIASKVKLQPFRTLDDVKKLAIKVKKLVKVGKKPYNRLYNSGSSLNPKVGFKCILGAVVKWLK